MRIRQSFIALIVAVASLPLASAPPQQPSPDATPKFSAQTELVLVPVIVHKGGQHLAGLTKDDFILQQDGKPQPIAIFEEIHAAAPTKVGTPPALEFSNAQTGGAAERFTIIALDLVNTAPLDQAYLKQEILKFLDSAAQTNEPFSLVAITRTGIRVLHDFTTDPKLLVAAVKRQSIQNAVKENAGGTVMDITPCAASDTGCGGGAGDRAQAAVDQLQNWERLQTNQEQFEIFRDRTSRMDTLAALQQLAQSLRGLPGRKTLVWASSGMQVLGGINRALTGIKDLRGGASFSVRGVNEALDQNAYTYNLLSSANIAVYPLDARHGSNTSFANYDVNRSDAPLDRDKEATRAANLETIDMFQQVAAATGGKPCFNRTDLVNCLKEAASDSHEYYMLGFYADKKAKPGWHPISVKLNTQKADLRYRGGFLNAAFDAEKSKLTDLQLAMMSPVPYTSVAITGRFTGTQAKGARRVVNFELDLPPQTVSISDPDNHMAFDVVAVVRVQGGKEAAKIAQRIDKMLQPAQAAQIIAQGIHYTNKLELDPGSYGVWFVVRDNVSGRTGSAMAPLTVQ